MVNPQLENGYIKVANEIWDALVKIRISGEARQILDFIIRKTYGFNKKSDRISLSQFQQATEIKQPNIVRAVKKLISMNIIIKKDNKIGATYLFNKHYDTWKPLSKKITQKRVIKKDNPKLSKKIINPQISLSKKIHTKDNKERAKDMPTKNNSESKSDSLKKDRKIPNTNHAKLIEYWMQIYHNRFGEKYDFKRGKDGSVISRILKTYGLKKCMDIMETFLNTDDEFYRKAGWTIGVLSSNVNKLIQKPILANDPMSKFSELSRNNIRVAKEWLMEKNREIENGT